MLARFVQIQVVERRRDFDFANAHGRRRRKGNDFRRGWCADFGNGFHDFRGSFRHDVERRKLGHGRLWRRDFQRGQLNRRSFRQLRFWRNGRGFRRFRLGHFGNAGIPVTS